MAASTLRTQVSLPTSSGLPADVIMNTWHCQFFSGTAVAAATNFVANLLDFYLSIDAFMSGRLSGNIDFKVYDLVDPLPRSVIYNFTSTLSLGSGDGLPNECAICLSYYGTIGSGLVAARHRGRIFLGPWDVSVVDQGTGDTIVDASVRNGIKSAADTFAGACVADGCPWAVFSPSNAGGPTYSAGDLLVGTDPVTGGWVDDAFDTVRSRGGLAQNRSVFP